MSRPRTPFPAVGWSFWIVWTTLVALSVLLLTLRLLVWLSGRWPLPFHAELGA